MKPFQIVMVMVLAVSGLAAISQPENIHQAVIKGDLEAVRTMLNAEPKLLESRDAGNLTPLHLAAVHGQTAIARFLLEKGAEPNARETNGRTPLFFSARQGSLSLCKLLAARGAQADIYNKFDRGPLLYAVWGGHNEIIRFLIAAGADIDKKDATGLYPLHHACLEGLVDSIKVLIDAGADLAVQDPEGHTPLHSAADYGHEDAVAVMAAAGADVAARDHCGDTPLHGAAWHGARKAADALLAEKADINARNNQGRTPLDYAVKTGHGPCAQMLRDRGAIPGEPSSPSIKQGDIPLPAGEGETDPITMTVLYDNTVAAEGTKGEWGFSCLIEGTEKTILFDTGGNAETFQHNVGALNVDLNAVEAVVISHEHWDHINGLPVLLKTNPHAPIHIPYQSPYDFVRRVESASGEVVPIDEPAVVCKHVYLTGQMGTQIKEQSLIVNTPQGLVIVTGCSHQGIVNILKKAKQVLNRDIHLVFGGFHLMGHSKAQVASIIREFKDLGVRKCGATHCTGDAAIQMFKDAYGDDYIEIGAGRILRFGEKPPTR